MAGADNLKAPSTAEARERGRKGGKNSAVIRGFKKAVKQYICDNPNAINEIVERLFKQALTGDLKAVSLLVELNDESIKQQEIILREREIAIREEKAQREAAEDW